MCHRRRAGAGRLGSANTPSRLPMNDPLGFPCLHKRGSSRFDGPAGPRACDAPEFLPAAWSNGLTPSELGLLQRACGKPGQAPL